MKPGKIYLLIIALALFAACNNRSATYPSGADSAIKETAKSPNLKEENITYTGDGITMDGYVVYDAGKEGKRPAVLVVHEWWGLNDYPKMRARKLAELGYIAMAVDMYGNGKSADNPDDAGKMAGTVFPKHH